MANLFRLFQYDITVAPVATPAAFDPSTNETVAHQPWSEPVRQKIAPALAIALIASGAVIDPFVLTQQERVSEDKWHQPLSEPVVKSKPRLPEGEQQFLAFVEAAPFPESVTEDRWHQPWSEPVRVKPRLPEGEQQALAFVEAAPFPERVSLDKWLLPLSEPVRIPPRLLEARQQFLAFAARPPIVAGPDSWWQPLTEPIVKTKARLIEANQQAFIFGESAQFPESVTEDRWHQPWSEPVRIKPRLPEGEQQFLAFARPPLVAGPEAWWRPWHEPVRVKSRLPDGEQQALAFVEAAPFPESITEDRWHQPLSEPVRIPARLITGAQQAQAFVFPVTQVETITLDKWFEPLHDRFRLKPGLATQFQQALAFVEAAPFGEQVSADRWFQPWQVPLRGMAPAPDRSAQPFLFTPPAAQLVAIDWYGPFGEPVRSRLAPLRYEPLALVLTVEVPASVAPAGHGSYPTWWDQAQQVAVRLQEQKRKPVKPRHQRPEIIQPAPVQAPHPIPLPDLPREAGVPSLPPPSFAEFNHPDPLGLANQIQDAQDLQDAFALLAQMPDPEVEALRQALLDLQDQQDIQDLLAALSALDDSSTA